MQETYRHDAAPFIKFCSRIFLPKVQHFILGIIVFNSLILGLETSPAIVAASGGLLAVLDSICLGIFVIELSMKIMVLRLSFFKSPWNVFDFLVVAISLVPSSGPLAILRALRVMRVLRLVTNLPRLRMIVESILISLPSIGWISGLLLIVFYIFAVLVTTLFGEAFPELFGDMGKSMYTLFQMITLDSWSSGITRPIMEQFPYAFLVFIPFVLLSAFIVLNVFIGIIVSAMGEVATGGADCGKNQTDQDTAGKTGPDLAEELRLLKEQISKVEKLLETQKDR